MAVLRRLAPMLQWFGYVLSLGAVAGLVILVASLVAQPVGAKVSLAQARAEPTQPAPLAEVPSAVAASSPTASPPSDLWIPALGLRAPVVAITPREVTLGGQRVAQLDVPNAFAAGWNALSAPVGSPGNTVLVGHNNEFGEVFRSLDRLVVGDEIMLYTPTGDRRYIAAEVVTLEEEWLPMSGRLANAAWIAPSVDERLTLVTCWPYVSNTHRLVVVARPVN